MRLRHLDHFLRDRGSLSDLRKTIDKIEKCCHAVDSSMNLADLLRDSRNFDSLARQFGTPEEVEVGLQIVFRTALEDHLSRSFTVKTAIEGEKRISFFHRAFGAWKGFDTVFVFQTPGNPLIQVVNPARRDHWEELVVIEAGTLVTVYVRSHGKRSRTQEETALERYRAAFEIIQDAADEKIEEELRKIVPLSVNGSNGGAARPTATPRATGSRPKAMPNPRARQNPWKKASGGLSGSPGGKPSHAFQIVINKLDTFVHAGNAHLITDHIQNYSGTICLYVLRAEKKMVPLDVDSIWGAEIRNGETVLYEFFGPVPDEEFVKELAKRTNKYTQMDKMVNE